MLLADHRFFLWSWQTEALLVFASRQFPAQTGKACKNIEDQPAATGCGVNGFGQALKPNPFLLKLCDGVE
jgi:hypothetical protein